MGKKREGGESKGAMVREILGAVDAMMNPTDVFVREDGGVERLIVKLAVTSRDYRAYKKRYRSLVDELATLPQKEFTGVDDDGIHDLACSISMVKSEICFSVGWIFGAAAAGARQDQVEHLTKLLVRRCADWRRDSQLRHWPDMAADELEEEAESGGLP